MNYIRKRSLALYDEAGESIEEVEKKFEDPPNLRDPTDVSVETDSVTLEDDESEVITSELKKDVTGEAEFSSLDQPRARASQIESVDVSSEYTEFVSDAQATQKKLEAIEKMNSRMKEVGSSIRFVVHSSESPESAYVYKHDLAPFYFEVDSRIRPSDVVKQNGDESWWAYDEDERVFKTIIALTELFEEPMKFVNSVEKCYPFVDRVLKTADEVVDDEDTFSLSQQDAVVSTIVEARSSV